MPSFEEPHKEYSCEAVVPERQHWLIGMIFVKWSCLEAQLERTAHGIADGDKKLWDAFNTEESLEARLKIINAVRYDRLESEHAAELNWLLSKTWRLRQRLENILDRSFERRLGWIEPVEPGERLLPARWTLHFMPGSCRWTDEGLLQVAHDVDELRLKFCRFNRCYGDPNPDGSIVSSEKIRTMFAIKDVGWTQQTSDWEE